MSAPDITRLLRDVDENRPGAMDHLMAAAYEDLRRVAERHLGERFGPGLPGATLEPAALVNESFLRLVVLGSNARELDELLDRTAAWLTEHGFDDDADPVYADLVAHRRRDGVAAETLASALLAHGETITRRGRPEEAEPLLREALDLRRASLPADDWQVHSAAAGLAVCLMRMRKWGQLPFPILTSSCGRRGAPLLLRCQDGKW
jgi:hypothetical protein